MSDVTVLTWDELQIGTAVETRVGWLVRLMVSGTVMSKRQSRRGRVSYLVRYVDPETALRRVCRRRPDQLWKGRGMSDVTDERLDTDTRQHGSNPPFDDWEGDHTALVHVLWSAKSRGLTVQSQADEIATMVLRSRWLKAQQHFARIESGIARVDTRSDATVERVARALCASMCGAYGDWGNYADQYRLQARAVLSSLLNEGHE